MSRKFYNNMKGFTLVEILLVFAISGIILGAGITSSSILTNNQTFNSSVSEVMNTLNVARSRAISQIKPATCGAGSLDGYEIRVALSGSDYEQAVVCGGVRTVIERRKLASSLTFDSASTVVNLFNVANGTMTNPSNIIIRGLGKTSTIYIKKTGSITVLSGAPTVVSAPTPTALPTAVAGCNTSNANYRLYPAPYNCVEVPPGYGTYCEPTCGQPNVTPSCNKRYYFYTPPATCYDLGAGAFAGTHCEATCGGMVSTTPVVTTAPTATTAPAAPTATTAPAAPTATTAPAAPTATTAPAPASTVISMTSSGNQSTVNQSVTYNVTVTGNNCTPLGQVRFFKNGVLFTAIGLTTGTNPKTGSASHAFTAAGTYQIQAKYLTSSTCPNADSSFINHTVQ